MHRHHRRFHHHGPRFFRPWMPFGGFIWFFVFAMLFMGGGRWLPGLIVLIVLASVFGSLFRGASQSWTQDQPPVKTSMPPQTPTVITVPVDELLHRVDLLPINCAQCGGPIRSNEVRWTGKQSAACPYCGSDLPMKKS
jgi:DNA-directed RNA polymerase subunit RPC12/RpoP